MTTFVVTVTYGNRFHLLKQVIDAALREGVDKVIVVDNNSVPESREKLRAYEQELGCNKIKVLYLDDNYGSAGGFKRGLEEAYNDPYCEFIWLLDDDNVPEKDALKKIFLAYSYLGNSDKNVLVSYRFSFENDRLAINNGVLIGYRANEFLGFHIKKYLVKKITGNNFYQANLKGIKIDDENYKIVRSQVGPYGGLFCHKKVIETVGYPKEDFFVYADDHEWTLRMTKAGFSLYLCCESKIKDIDWTWEKSKCNHPYYDPSANEIKIYYGIRNHVFVCKTFVTNKAIFNFNMSIWLTYYFSYNILLAPKIAFNRFKLIIRAVKDGLSGKLGKVYAT